MNLEAFIHKRRPQPMGKPDSCDQYVCWARTWNYLGIGIFEVFILLLFATSAHAAFPDPLGLKWGLELSDFHQMDFDIEEEWPMGDRSTAIRLSTPSQTLPDSGSLLLVFDQEVGLVKTQWASMLIERDEPGTKGLDAFDQLKTTLTRQYGPPDTTQEELSVKLQGFHGRFYQCLQEETCGQWQSIWKTPKGGILMLELVGLRPGVGFIQITHQSPYLNNIRPATPQHLPSHDHHI